MKQSKKYLLFLLIPLLSGCSFNLGNDSDINSQNNDDSTNNNGNENNNSNSNQDNSTKEFSNFLTIYSLNDSHGDLLRDTDADSNGYDGISALIKQDNLDDTSKSYFTICTGDMFQGQYVSNNTRGAAVVDALNYIDCKAFVLGNHEFDWGLEELKKYKDGNLENGELNCDFLGANIIQKSINKRPDWIKPYSIVEQNGHKIGIIGFIGEDIETSVLTERIKDYEFTPALPLYEKYSELLKNNYKCDLIVAAIHDYDAKYFSFLETNIPPHAIFGGHTHRYDLTYGTSPKIKYKVPFIQSGCNNEGISKVKFIFDQNKNVTFASPSSLRNNITSTLLDNDLRTFIVNKYQDIINQGDEKITKNLKPMSKREWITFVAKSLITEEVDGSCINNGGIRYDTLYSSSTTLTNKQLFRILPFDNKIYQVKIDKAIYDNYMTTNSKNKFVMRQKENNNSYYIINVIDYVFTHVREAYTWKNAEVIKVLDLNIRDHATEYIKNNIN